MKILPAIFTIRHLRMVSSCLASLLCAASFALGENIEDEPGGGDDDPGGCEESDADTESFDWYLKIGDAFYEAGENFLKSSRFSVIDGQSLGNMPRSMDQLLAQYYGGSAVNRRPVTLKIEQTTVSSATLNPASLVCNPYPTVELVKNGDTLRQIVTDNTFVDIVPQTLGFAVRVYDIQYKSSTKTAGLYTLTSSVNPIYETIFTTDDGLAYDDTLQIISIDRRNSSVRVDYKRFITSPSAGTVVKEIYTGTISGSTPSIGTKVEEATATYSTLGSNPYDYTLVKETKRAVSSATSLGIPTYGSLVTVARTLDQYEDFTISGGGDSRYKRLVRHVDGYGSTEPRETVYTWYNQPANEYVHGRLQSVVRPDQSWEYYTYLDGPTNSTAQETKYEGWKDQLYGSTNLNDAKKTVTSITGANSYTRTVSIGAQVIAQEKKTFATISGGKTLTTERKIGSEWQTEITAYHSQSAAPLLAGRPMWTQHTDGTYTTFAYSTVSGNLQVVEKTGAGSSSVTSGTQTTKVYNKWNKQISKETKDIISGLVLNSWMAIETDTIGRPTHIVYNANLDDYEEFQYFCCGLGYHRKRDASVEHIAYDHFRRQIWKRYGHFYGDANGIVSITTYDGLTTSTSTGGLFMSSTTRKLNGETTSTQSADQNGDGSPEQTTYSYNYPTSGGKIVTCIHPEGGTEIREYYVDRHAKAVTGTAVAPVSYDYGTHNENGGGLTTTTSRSATEWEKTYFDSLQRSFRLGYPSDWNGDSELDAATIGYYGMSASAGSRGKLQTTVDPDGVTSTCTYDVKGELATHTTTMPNSQSRVTSYVHDVVNDATLGVSRRTRTTTNGVLTNTALISGDGYRSRTSSLGKVTTRVKVVSTSAGNATQTMTQPDGTKQARVITGNLLIKQVWLDTADNELWSMTYTYDALDRMTSATDSRTGTTSYLMNASGVPVAVGTSGAVSAYTYSGNLRGLRDPGGRITTYAYDVRGRRLTVDAPNTTDAASATLANITHTSYYPTGQVKATWGDQTYASFYQYDEQGRTTQLRTYRGLAHGTEPTASTTGYDATTWVYDAQRGLLSQKRDHANVGADYTYTPAGRLATRQWARTAGSSRLTTTYGYDAGLLTTTDYSDGTPGVTISYDAFGRQVEVLQEYQSKVAYTYDATTQAVDTETVSYDLDHNGTYEFSRVIDRHPVDSIGRETGWQLKTGSTVENEVTYGYHAASGRLNQVDGGSLGAFAYGYTANSPALIASVTGPVNTVANTWAATLDTLTLKENQVGSTVVSSYRYTVNALGQREGMVHDGTAHGGGDGAFAYRYNAKGEVATVSRGPNPSYPGIGTVSHSWGFAYDGIGNREALDLGDSSVTASTVTYASNALNQYTAIDSVSPSYDVDGNATAYPLPVSSTSNGTLAWDGENRLLSITVGGVTTAYHYDAQSRRIAKTSGTTTTVTVYDGWNPIADYQQSGSGTPALSRVYQWGLDLSGSLQGAGGVGGMLSMKVGSSLYYPQYDGNGNVTEYLTSTGALSALFLYDAYGNTVVNTDTAGLFDFRFSSKRRDVQTGLYYYGYRYYDPVTGRWPSRDPIEERGGVNLYGFVKNKSIHRIDFLGLSFWGWITGQEGWLPGDQSGFIDALDQPVGDLGTPQGDIFDAIDMGLDFLTGTDDPVREFGENSPMTDAIRDGYLGETIRNRIKVFGLSYCKGSGEALPHTLSLGNELSSIPGYQYPFQFAAWLFSNPVTAFTGSFSGGSIVVTSVDCNACVAEATIHAVNQSGAESSTRLPPFLGGYNRNGPMTGVLGMNIDIDFYPTPYFEPFSTLLPDSPMGSNSPLNTIGQTYDWNESVNLR